MVKKAKEKAKKFLFWLQKHVQIDMMYFTKGSFWIVVGDSISAVASVLLSIAFANLLPKETFGVYRYVLSLAAVLAFPTLAGINTSLVQAIARGYEGSFIKGLKTKMKWGILGAVFSIILAAYYFFHGHYELTICFLIAGCFLPFMDSFLLSQSFWGGKKDFKTQNIFQVLIQIAAVMIAIAVLFITKNILWIVLTYFASYTFLRLLFLVITIKKANLNNKEDPQTIPYGKHLTLMGVITVIVNQLDKIMLWHFLGPVAVAVYSFAILMPDNARTFLKDMEILILPKFSQRNKEDLRKNLPHKLKIIFPILVLLTVIYIFLAPWVFKIFFPKYMDALVYSQIYSLCIIFMTIQIPVASALTSQMEKKKLYIFRTISPLLQAAFLIMLLPWLGIWGAITGILISQILSFWVLMILFKRMA